MRTERNEYQRTYRRNNPEKIARWEYNRAKRIIREFELHHPTDQEQRLAEELPAIGVALPGMSLEEMGGVY